MSTLVFGIGGEDVDYRMLEIAACLISGTKLDYVVVGDNLAQLSACFVGRSMLEVNFLLAFLSFL